MYYVNCVSILRFLRAEYSCRLDEKLSSIIQQFLNRNTKRDATFHTSISENTNKKY